MRLRALRLALMLFGSNLAGAFSSFRTANNAISIATKSSPQSSDEALVTQVLDKVLTSSASSDSRDAMEERMHSYYLPVYRYIEKLVNEREDRDRPLFVG